MRNSIKIILTIAVVFASAISIFTQLQDAPPLDPINDPYDLHYKAYMLNHSLMFSVFVVVNMLVWFIGYCNRVIKACIILNCIIFVYMGIKVLYLDLSKNQMLDNVALGVALIVSFYYLIHIQTKDIRFFVKNMLNHIRTKWPKTNRQKHGLPE